MAPDSRARNSVVARTVQSAEPRVISAFVRCLCCLRGLSPPKPLPKANANSSLPDRDAQREGRQLGDREVVAGNQPQAERKAADATSDRADNRGAQPRRL